MAAINYKAKAEDIVESMSQVFEYIPLRGNSGNLTLADQAYEHILKNLVFPDQRDTDAVLYGGKITESVLAKALKMSNGPVREAIFRLRQEGWIETIGNKGSFLVDFSNPEIAREIYMFRISFETGAFYSLAATAVPEQINVLKKILDVMETAKADSDIESFRRADIAFHLEVVEFAGGNDFRLLFRSKLLQWYAMAYQIITKSMSREDYSHHLEAPGTSTHQELFEAIQSHNSELAARLITNHYTYLANILGIKRAKLQTDTE